MQFKKFFAPLAVCLTLAGCATQEYYFGKPGASTDEFQRDKTTCEDATFTAGNVLSGKYVELRNACMLNKGWKQMDAPAAQPAR